MHGCFLSAATSRQLIDDLTTPKLPSHAQPAKIACTIAFASTTTAALPAVFRARARITTDGPFGSLGPQASRSALVSSPPLPPTTRLVVPYYRATGTRLLFDWSASSFSRALLGASDPVRAHLSSIHPGFHPRPASKPRLDRRSPIQSRFQVPTALLHAPACLFLSGFHRQPTERGGMSLGGA